MGIMSSAERAAVIDLRSVVVQVWPEAISARCYYLPDSPAQEDEEGRLGVEAIEGLTELPWPERNCLVMTRLGDKMFLLVHNGMSRADVQMHMEKSDGADEADSFLFLEKGIGDDRQVRPGAGNVWMVHYDGSRRSGWFATRMDDEPTDGHVALTKGLAVKVMRLLLNIACPTGYTLKLRSRSGFLRKAVRGKGRPRPLIALINRDRLYRCLPEGEEKDHMVSPHWRRGHVRWLWKHSAGIDRMTLPRDPVERLRVALQNRVANVTVHPSWVGNTHWRDGPDEFDVMTGESPSL